MTVIAGVEDRNRVWLAGDSRWSDEEAFTDSTSSKVWRSGGWVVGFSGSGRPGSLFRYTLDMPNAPKQATSSEIERLILRDLLSAIGKTLVDAGIEITYGDDKDSEYADWGLLVGVAGQLWEIDSNLQATRSGLRYNAIGTGGHLALGALSVLPRTALTAEQRLREAVGAAITHSPGCGGKVRIVHT